MKLIVTYQGKKFELGKPHMLDLVMLERHFGVGANALQNDPKMEYLVFLAFAGLRRAGVVSGKYTDEFIAELDDIESPEEDESAEGADPTGATPTQQPA